MTTFGVFVHCWTILPGPLEIPVFLFDSNNYEDPSQSDSYHQTGINDRPRPNSDYSSDGATQHNQPNTEISHPLQSEDSGHRQTNVTRR